MVHVCGVLHSTHFPFATRVIKQLLILQSGLALTDLSNAAFSPISVTADVCVPQMQLCRRRLSRFLVTSCY